MEISFAKSFIALALEELEEDRPDHRPGEALLQHLRHAAFNHVFAIDEDGILLQKCQRLAMGFGAAAGKRAIMTATGRG